MRVFVILIAIGLIGCKSKPAELKIGNWRGVITLQNHQLPFNFEVTKDSGEYKVFLKNAEEKLLQDEISIEGDSVKITMLIFDIELRAKINGGQLNGYYFKNYDPDFKLPFTADFNQNYRFVKQGTSLTDFSGKYEVKFTTANKTYPSVAIFEQKENIVTGTFLTPTGDYRYLEGNVVNDTLLLSTFDGNHAFLFSAQMVGDSLIGDYYSGKSKIGRAHV